MGSLFLSRQTPDERHALISRLHNAQSGKCFICEEKVDLVVHKNAIDSRRQRRPEQLFAHPRELQPLKTGFELGSRAYPVPILAAKKALEEENRSSNLGDLLTDSGGGNHKLGFKIEGNTVTYSFAELGDNTLCTVPVYEDELSGFRYFFARMPIQYLAHDSHINPRSIGANISKLVEEFYQKRPQLHVALAWLGSKEGRSAIHVFDGQHKAAAQIMLGVRYLPVRVFIDPDPDTLITTNTNAGTTLKQVAFDKSVQRHLGSALYQDRVHRFQTETGRAEDDMRFSERDLVNHFKGQSREIKRFILDALRNG